jgi:hypothetical protein
MSSPGTGALLQLALRGPQNDFIDDPNGKNFFSTCMRRHTRFALDIVEETFPNGFVFGKVNVVEISRRADVLGDVILEIHLPAVPAASADDTWVDSFGYVLLRRIRLVLGDIVVHDDERLWYDISDKLFCSAGHRRGLHEMIGASGRLSLRTAHVVHVPLKLLTSKMHRKTQNFLPLLAMPGTRFELEITTESVENCVRLAPRTPLPSSTEVFAVFVSRTAIAVTLPAETPVGTIVRLALNGTDIATAVSSAQSVSFANVSILDGVYTVTCGAKSARAIATQDLIIGILDGELPVKALFHVAFLDKPEKDQVLQKRFAMLYETVNDVETLSHKELFAEDEGVVKMPLSEIFLDFSEVSRATKLIACVAYEESSVFRRDYFTYLPDAILEAKVIFDGTDRVSWLPWEYFRLLERHDRVGRTARNDGIGAFSFALDASAWQPSGTAPFGAMKRPMLHITQRSKRSGIVYKAFVVSYNIIVIEKGRATVVHAT